MIFLIKLKADWELTSHKYQMQINKDNIHKNRKILDHNYKVGDKFIIDNKAA